MMAKQLPCRTNKREQGFVLLMAVVMTTLMLTASITALNRALDQYVIAAAMGRTEDSSWVAEAGAVWGADQLANLIYPKGVAGGISLTQIQASPQLDPGDVLCADGVACNSYYLLTTSGPMVYGGGTYRVAATCYPNACTSAPKDVVGFAIRSAGTLGDGTPVVVEMGFTVQ